MDSRKKYFKIPSVGLKRTDRILILTRNHYIIIYNNIMVLTQKSNNSTT